MPGRLRIVPYFLAGLGIAYGLMVLVLWLLQNRITYPAPLPGPTHVQGVERVTYKTADGLDLHGGWIAPRNGLPTLVAFHGNGENWQSSVATLRKVAGAGYGLLAAEYRGYDGNPGTPSEEGLYRDGRAALQFLDEQGVEPGNIVLVGGSIGSGVAVQLATETSAKALILVAPFDSLTDTAARALPWLPTRMIMGRRFDNVAKIGTLDLPVLIVHGDEDALVLLEQAERLIGRYPAAELVVREGQGHEIVADPSIRNEILYFLSSTL